MTKKTTLALSPDEVTVTVIEEGPERWHRIESDGAPTNYVISNRFRVGGVVGAHRGRLKIRELKSRMFKGKVFARLTLDGGRRDPNIAELLLKLKDETPAPEKPAGPARLKAKRSFDSLASFAEFVGGTVLGDAIVKATGCPTGQDHVVTIRLEDGMKVECDHCGPIAVKYAQWKGLA